jgi:ferrochelatase
MAYGTATSASEADVRSYLTHILQFYRETDPSDNDVRYLKARYEAVGGSPFYDITARIVSATGRALDSAAPGAFRVYSAMKHSPPLIADVVRRIAADGHSRAIALALTPFPSRLSSEGYFELVREANGVLPAPLEWRFTESWHLHVGYLALWEGLVREALDGFEQPPVVLFTNHSLPKRIRQWNDPYEEAFAATAGALAERLGLEDWGLVYQSAGGGATPWLGPSIEDALRERAAGGARRVLLAPIGFLMDHLEVLYDIDVMARRLADQLGVRLERTRMPNDDPKFVALLVDVIRRTETG